MLTHPFLPFRVRPRATPQATPPRRAGGPGGCEAAPPSIKAERKPVKAATVATGARVRITRRSATRIG